MACPECKRDIAPYCRGLCQSCYLRLKKTGNLPPIVKRQRTKCSVEGCEHNVVSHGYCRRHYMRLRRHGHVEKTRPYLEESKTKHPMYETWKGIHKRRHTDPIPREWEDFYKFIEDVGERPSPQHRLVKRDKDFPYSKTNLHWIAPLEAELGETTEEIRKRRFREMMLSKKYKISCIEYSKLLKKQRWGCAICRCSPEENKKNDVPVALAVDHDHSTGNLRGLLCWRCNIMIGGAVDSIDILKSAISYLKKHRSDKSD